MRDGFHSAFRFCFQGMVMVAMSLHGPVAVCKDRRPDIGAAHNAALPGNDGGGFGRRQP